MIARLIAAATLALLSGCSAWNWGEKEFLSGDYDAQRKTLEKRQALSVCVSETDYKHWCAGLRIAKAEGYLASGNRAAAIAALREALELAQDPLTADYLRLVLIQDGRADEAALVSVDLDWLRRDAVESRAAKAQAMALAWASFNATNAVLATNVGTAAAASSLSLAGYALDPRRGQVVFPNASIVAIPVTSEASASQSLGGGREQCAQGGGQWSACSVDGRVHCHVLCPVGHSDGYGRDVGGQYQCHEGSQ